MLDHAGLAAFQLGYAVVVAFGAGIDIHRFIDGRLKVGLGGLPGQIGAGYLDLQGRIVRRRCHDVKIFSVHNLDCLRQPGKYAAGKPPRLAGPTVETDRGILKTKLWGNTIRFACPHGLSDLRLSIVVPVLNEAESVVSCLEKLQSLRRRGHEIIVVDGGSSDGTRSLAAPLCDLLLRSRRGRGEQMNLGAAFASGDVLLFLHVDNELPPRAEQALAGVFVAAEPGWGWFRVRMKGAAPIYRVIAALMNIRAKCTAICTGDQAMFVSATLFAKVGGFQRIPLMEDIAISAKLKKLAKPHSLNLPTTTSARRWESRGLARTVLQMWWLRLLYALGVSPDWLAARYYPSLFGACSREKYPRARILLFAKEPEASKVKTRLAATIGDEAALRLQLAMLRRALETLEREPLAEFHLWAASNPRHRTFLALCNAQDIRAQQGADLGARMHYAAARELADERVDSVLIVGSDCPALSRGYLDQALAALAAGADVVLGPARDGGYVLIGLREANAELFRGVKWGGGEVLRWTLANIRRLGLRHRLLEPLWDVDEAADLPLLESLRPPLRWESEP